MKTFKELMEEISPEDEDLDEKKGFVVKAKSKSKNKDPESFWYADKADAKKFADFLRADGGFEVELSSEQ